MKSSAAGGRAAHRPESWGRNWQVGREGIGQRREELVDAELQLHIAGGGFPRGRLRFRLKEN